jgi:hypothetical protein
MVNPRETEWPAAAFNPFYNILDAFARYDAIKPYGPARCGIFLPRQVSTMKSASVTICGDHRYRNPDLIPGDRRKQKQLRVFQDHERPFSTDGRLQKSSTSALGCSEGAEERDKCPGRSGVGSEHQNGRIKLNAGLPAKPTAVSS